MPPSLYSETARHRKLQLALRATTLRDLLKLWPAFDISNIAKSWGPLEEALVLLMESRAGTSSGLATRYYQDVRRLAGASGATSLVTTGFDVDKAVTNLRIVGPGNAGKQLALGRPMQTVAKATLVNVSGEVSRQVLNAGRETVNSSVKADRQSVGWRRVTSGSACEFCSMLAGRGIVYKSDTVDFSAHRHCACFPEPAFR